MTDSIQKFITDFSKLVRENRHFSVKAHITDVEVLFQFYRNEEPSIVGDFPAVLSFPLVGKDGSITCPTGVKRVCGTFLLNKKEVSLYDIFIEMFKNPPDKLFSNLSSRPLLPQILNGIRFNSIPLSFRSVQKAISFVVNKLPLAGTPYEQWAMSNRVMVIDPAFDKLQPHKALEYQTEINKKMFPWTSLGLSDSGMCNNALLKVDLRKIAPFAIRHHNPHRNLYQTLGMRGDQSPTVVTETEVELEEAGVKRGGWNLMTAFLDLPGNFEDQIILNERLKKLKVRETKQFICWGTVVVYENEKIKMLTPISVEPNGEIKRFENHAEKAWVSSIKERKTTSNGLPEKFNVVEITVERSFKDGFKITNRHGNKGVVWMTETGYVDHPTKGKVPLDVIVSATSVKKRKNFGQLFEAICTVLSEKKRIVIPDNKNVNDDGLKKVLEKNNYKEALCKVKTPWGEFETVCGKVFWGFLKSPEDQVWNRKDVRIKDNKGLRKNGVKISHIELKAMMTMFGPKNPVVKEILDYQQGDKYLSELLCISQSIIGHRLPSCPVVKCKNINTINQSNGFLHEKDELEDTTATIYPDGFILELPLFIKIELDNRKNRANYSISNASKESFSNDEIVLNKIYIPSTEARILWKHQSGKVGTESLLSFVNNLVRAGKGDNKRQILITFRCYVEHISKVLSAKAGKVSDLGMAIRYPHSVKATAMLGDNLPKNTIQIHKEMAEDLKVKKGDVVLVERFPCLGFMSIRPQKVQITEDGSCRYVIRVSGNSLNSLNLDFDGDVLFVMSFKTKEANEAIRTLLNKPHKGMKEAVEAAERKKVPKIEAMKLSDYGIERFMDLTPDKNAEIVNGLTGIKRGTGTIVALCYNLMRIIERKVSYKDKETSICMEKLLDVVANSVFSRKHAGKSLEKECRGAIATADFGKMVKLGLDKKASRKLCQIIKDEANKMGVKNLKKDFENANKGGGSIIVNRIVRNHHKIWFASRATLPAAILARHIRAKPVDLASHVMKHYLSGQSKLAMLGV